MKIAYIARNDGTDMRVSKTCNSLLAFGHDVTFVGWRGTPDGEFPDPMPSVPKRFNAATVRLASIRLVRYVGFVRHVFSQLRLLNPDVVHCANEEYASIVIHRLGRSSRCHVVCDIFDSLALRMSKSSFPVRMFSRYVTRYAHKRSDRLIVTDERRRRRLGSFLDKAVVVPNYPVDPGPEFSLSLPSSRSPVRLYVAGSLNRARGLRAILSLLETREDVAVVSAGWLQDDLSRRFVEHPRVDFRGVITPYESLKLAASCHAIVALYEPSNENNILASPNKIYDALCIGRPVIINTETAISQWVSEQEAGFLVKYGDGKDLDRVVEEVLEGRFEGSTQRLRTLFERGFSWSVAERQLRQLYLDFESGGRE